MSELRIRFHLPPTLILASLKVLFQLRPFARDVHVAVLSFSFLTLAVTEIIISTVVRPATMRMVNLVDSFHLLLKPQ